MRKRVAKKIANHIADWSHRGIIDAELSATLQARYQSDNSTGRVFVCWLGFLAVTMLGMSVLRLIGSSIGEAAQFLAPIILGGAASVSWTKGVVMATDRLQHYPTSGAVLVTFSLLLAFAALMTAYMVSAAAEVSMPFQSLWL